MWPVCVAGLAAVASAIALPPHASLKFLSAQHSDGNKDSAHANIHHHMGISDKKYSSCNLGSKGCHTLCRWLALTTGDDKECVLFEKPIKTCGYILPEKRQGLEKDAILTEGDCAVNALRGSVLKEEVEHAVASLHECLDGLPKKILRTCSVAFGLLNDEVADWHREDALKKNATEAERKMMAAAQQGRIALSTGERLEQAADRLDQALEFAQAIPGHYLSQRNIASQRHLLGRLQQAPVIIREMNVAVENGETLSRNVSSDTLFQINEAKTLLRTAIAKARSFQLAANLPAGRQLLLNLTRLGEAMETLLNATEYAEISLGTRDHMSVAATDLEAAIEPANAWDINTQRSKKLLLELQELAAALDDAATARAAAHKLLESSGQMGLREMAPVIHSLNRSIEHAQTLGLGDERPIVKAQTTLQRLRWVNHAREALHQAAANGSSILVKNASSPSDDAEEFAIANLEPAIKWAKEVGLVGGVRHASELLNKLNSQERVKEELVKGKALAEESLNEKDDEHPAIHELVGALAEARQDNLSAIAKDAENDLMHLVMMRLARRSLAKSVDHANKSLLENRGMVRAMAMLKRGIAKGVAANLSAEDISIAKMQASKLQDFLDARHNLSRSLEVRLVTSPPPAVAEVVDRQAQFKFNKTGLAVQQLPQVANSQDDGDADFDEHILAILNSIKADKRLKVVDPNKEKQLEHARAMKLAYAAIENATNSGEQAVASEAGVEEAALELTTAIKLSVESSMLLGVPLAKDLQRKLDSISGAHDELERAMVRANSSKNTQMGMDGAKSKLAEAISKCKQIGLHRQVPEAETLLDELTRAREAYLALKTAIRRAGNSVRGNGAHAEEHLSELNEALTEAQAAGLRKRMPMADDMIERLKLKMEGHR